MNEKKEIPFFARFLEGQDALQVRTNLRAGATLKFPSDRDEHVHTTQKYPSDDDEGGEPI